MTFQLTVKLSVYDIVKMQNDYKLWYKVYVFDNGDCMARKGEVAGRSEVFTALNELYKDAQFHQACYDMERNAMWCCNKVVSELYAAVNVIKPVWTLKPQCVLLFTVSVDRDHVFTGDVFYTPACPHGITRVLYEDEYNIKRLWPLLLEPLVYIMNCIERQACDINSKCVEGQPLPS